MLVLTREKTQGIQIGKDVRIVVLDVRGDKVRLGIEAPKKIAVFRDEIYKQILEASKREGADG